MENPGSNREVSDVELALEDVGHCGLYHVWLILLMALPNILVGAHMGSSVFLAMIPTHYCITEQADKISNVCNITWVEEYNEMILGEKSSCNMIYYSNTSTIDCSIWQQNIQNQTILTPMPETRTCDAWVFDHSVMKTTIATEFGLVCGNIWASYVTQSIFMAGVLVGNIFIGLTSDRFGRRVAFLVSAVGSVTFGIATAFADSFVTFCILNGLTGIFVYCMFPVLFTLVSELVVARYRAALAQFAEAGFGTGFMMLALVAVFTRDWRRLQLAISAPIAVSLIVWWVLPESPRWLILNDQRKEANEIIGRMKQVNNLTTGCQRNQDGEATGCEEMKTFSSKTLDNDVIVTSSNVYGFLDLVRTSNLRRVSIIQFYQWFAVSCVYYGLTLNAAELGGDAFLNFFLIALVEVIGVFLVIPLVEKAGRVPCSSLSEVVAGIFCILMSYIPKDISWLYIGCSLVGKFAITVAFSVMYIHISELYPTPVRSVASGACNAWARLGAIASPVIAMLRLLVPDLPYIVFGILSIISGILILMTTETSKQQLLPTLEEGERFLASNPGPLVTMWRKLKSRR
nr:organic cation transporter protein [Ciona intestinalis]|eukprot:XP_026695721.1 organic cation transporter protein [Ciona intestinalis]